MREAVETGLILIRQEGGAIIRYQRACGCEAVHVRRQFDAAMNLQPLLTGWRPWRRSMWPLTDPAALRKGVVTGQVLPAPKGVLRDDYTDHNDAPGGICSGTTGG